jgi:hypothetical protein
LLSLIGFRKFKDEQTQNFISYQIGSKLFA